MNLLLWGLTLGTIGKLVLGIALLRVHAYILKEHKIDNVVLAALRRERYFTALGLILIVLGYVLEVFFYNGSTNLLDCVGGACAGALSAILAN
jgi:hypothetical protein